VGIFRRGIKDGVAAEARVIDLSMTAIAARQHDKRNLKYVLALEVTAPGHGVYAVTVKDTVPYDKTPSIGQSLPVTVSASDAQRVEVDWDRAPSLLDQMGAAGEAAKRGDTDAAARALGFELKDPEDPRV
jgi:hypothetical protein